MKSSDLLRHTEGLLAGEYGLEHLPKPLDAEDLECDSPVEAEHWVEVYTELLDFSRSVLKAGTGPDASAAREPMSGGATRDPRALILQARIQELRLAYWVDRVNRLRAEPGSDRNR